MEKDLFDKLIQVLVTNIKNKDRLGIDLVYTRLIRYNVKDSDIVTAISFIDNQFLGGINEKQ